MILQHDSLSKSVKHTTAKEVASVAHNAVLGGIKHGLTKNVMIKHGHTNNVLIKHGHTNNVLSKH